MPIRMIMTDLDDTLLRRDKTVSAYTSRILDACRKNGIRLAFATSRSLGACERLMNALSPDVIIHDGGACARTGRRILYRALLDDADAKGLISRFLDEDSVTQITVAAENGYFDSRPPDKPLRGQAVCPGVLHTDFSRPVDFGGIFKICVLTPDPAALARAVKDFPDVYGVGFTGEDWHMIRNSRAGKALAMAAVCADLDIAVRDVAAFGDDLSDIEMLEAAGAGVAVDNAASAVKAAADCVCPDCDGDGVAKWLEANAL